MPKIVGFVLLIQINGLCVGGVNRLVFCMFSHLSSNKLPNMSQLVNVKPATGRAFELFTSRHFALRVLLVVEVFIKHLVQ